MPKSNQNNENDNKKDTIIKIILIIIIIILLLHNCVLMRKKGEDDNGKVNIIDINCNSNKCQQETNEIPIDCIEDENNSKCLVPNFVGKSKKDVLKWLSLVSNTIEMEIKTVKNSNYKDGTVLKQSIYGINIKDLLSGKTKLVITIVNNGSLIDCQQNSQSSKCILPDFEGKKKANVENWLNGISNNVKVKYAYVDSKKAAGTVLSQSIKGGTSVKDILDKDETIVIYISKGTTLNINPYTGDNNSNNQGGNNNPSDQTPDEPTPEPDGDFYVSDEEIVRWQNETDLNIFEDSTSISKVRGKIAPESKGTYKFIVNNETKYNLKYNITFTETNQHNMNMKYKLKKGDTYLIDHYVSYNQLNLDNILLNSKTSDTYYLEWKWIGDNDSNDTQIGNTAKSSDVNYNLKIKVEAESI